MSTIHAVYENGVFRPTVPVDLPERCEVEISVAPPAADAFDDKSEKPLMELVEIARQHPSNRDRPSDYAAQIDHYLRGAPKSP